MMSITTRFLLILLLGLRIKNASGNQISFKNGDFVVSWNRSSDEIEFTIKAKTTGWLALGISKENIEMKNIDLFVGKYQNSAPSVEDYFSISQRMPDLDSQQNVILISGSEDNGFTTIICKRKLATGDGKDIKIEPGSKYYLAWAYGTSESLQYHFSTRGYSSAMIELVPPPPLITSSMTSSLLPTSSSISPSPTSPTPTPTSSLASSSKFTSSVSMSQPTSPTQTSTSSLASSSKFTSSVSMSQPTSPTPTPTSSLTSSSKFTSSVSMSQPTSPTPTSTSSLASSSKFTSSVSMSQPTSPTPTSTSSLASSSKFTSSVPMSQPTSPTPTPTSSLTSSSKFTSSVSMSQPTSPTPTSTSSLTSSSKFISSVSIPSTAAPSPIFSSSSLMSSLVSSTSSSGLPSSPNIVTSSLVSTSSAMTSSVQSKSSISSSTSIPVLATTSSVMTSPPTTSTPVFVDKLVFNNGGYNVSWKYDSQNKEVIFTLTVKATGWIGVGISDVNSGMHQMDVVVAWVDSNGQNHIKDFYANATGRPSRDGYQDASLLNGMQKSGITTIEYKKSIKTGDSNDIELVPGKSYYIAWAYHLTSDDFVIHTKRGYSKQKVVIVPSERPTTKPTTAKPPIPKTGASKESCTISVVVFAFAIAMMVQ